MLTLNTVVHTHHTIANTEVTIRPMTKEDAELESNFVHNLSFETKHNRFLEGINDLSPKMLARLCDIDGKNAMAFIATILHDNKEQQIGVSRYACEPDSNESEMAITVADEWQHHGLAQLLMKPLITYAQHNGISALFSIDLSSNTAMHRLAKALGMSCEKMPEDSRLLKYRLSLAHA
ncbi:MAG: GNAT family N-acetyltransferase [Paraglaciecola sp.]|uniref:GNAT family N-acetyltransferase n=1 Tax=Pseudomonadati TaxID=3379134 RepID=UPI00273F9327|nr:GNAT family N-acetyltransferase [Paraglaciecola sp.]MDP5032188.1 GNAT family N-acetyltransferase [Paraglaciecola sp.]MDP5133084.1 GNAT family N-acetyltransferase [Paraglaciecola sp.]